MFWKILLTFLISMVPIVELRGAVPIGVGMGVNPFLALAVSIIGNMIPVPFIFFFARKFLEWGKDKKLIGKFCKWVLKKGEKGGKKLTEKAGRSTYVALLLFVGIPIPGTGAWTGTLAASLLDLDFKKSSIAVICGVVLAGIIMLSLSLLGFKALGA
ncbi:small multi-drug export protein [Candidatus Saccharibacteria bacterium]|nr:small multi-drug export protein [Candidatus Saccharibacteria bacterium]